MTARVAPAVQPSRQWPVRLLTTALGLLGAAAIGYGVVAPWLSTYGGLLAQSGWATRNGSILFGLAIAGALLAAGQLVRSSSALRWALALTGFVAAGYAGYLLIQLYTVTQQFDGMTMVSKGPGLYVAAAGGALVFSTIFLPLPTGPAPVADDQVDNRGERSALGSALRFPVAALGMLAGLAHVPVTPAHLQEAPYIGVLFMIFTIAAILASTALLISDKVAIWVVLAGSCLLAIAAYTVSRTVGLPAMGDDIGHWLEPMGVVAVLSEVGVVVLTVLALSRARRSH